MILRLLARGRTGRRTAIPARTVETPRRSSVNLFKGHTSSTSVACAGASTRRMSAPAPPASRARVARRARRAAHRPRRRRRRADLLVRPRERGRVPGPVACRLASYIRSRHSPRRLTEPTVRAVTLADTLPAVRWRPVWRGVAPKRLSSEFPAGADLRGGGPLRPARLHRQSGKRHAGDRDSRRALRPAGVRKGPQPTREDAPRETRSAGPRRGGPLAPTTS